jgi:hypothetical protein
MSATKSGPTAPKCQDDEFMELFDKLGGEKTARIIGSTERNVYARRRRLESKYDKPIAAPSNQWITKEYPHRQQLSIKNGIVLIGGDFHIWPGGESTALRAFKKFAKDLKPAAVILNGDVLDFPKISRHPPIGWENTPTVKDELEAAQDHTQDIVTACGRAKKIWTLGNHDARFETRLATVATEYRGIKGIHLADHFPLWEKGWSCLINGDVEGGRTMVKHKPQAGGKDGPRNSTLRSGVHTVNNHTHCQKATAHSDYLGDRWGVDSGMIADRDHKAFVDYTEDASLDWRSGFVALTYQNGILMPPELVTKMSDKTVWFRGALHRV